MNREDKELIELGRKTQDFYETGYISKKTALSFTFAKGLVQGFGIFLGGTLIVTVLIWLLGSFKEIPLLGPVSEAVKRTLGK
jgi:hypothetical protein